VVDPSLAAQGGYDDPNTVDPSMGPSMDQSTFGDTQQSFDFSQDMAMQDSSMDFSTLDACASMPIE
jgi:hypothetical protein